MKGTNIFEKFDTTGGGYRTCLQYYCEEDSWRMAYMSARQYLIGLSIWLGTMMIEEAFLEAGVAIKLGIVLNWNETKYRRVGGKDSAEHNRRLGYTNLNEWNILFIWDMKWTLKIIYLEQHKEMPHKDILHLLLQQFKSNTISGQLPKLLIFQIKFIRWFTNFDFTDFVNLVKCQIERLKLVYVKSQVKNITLQVFRRLGTSKTSQLSSLPCHLFLCCPYSRNVACWLFLLGIFFTTCRRSRLSPKFTT